MLLIGVKDDGSWLNSRWNLTYKIGWYNILTACHKMYDYYQNPEILINNEMIDIKNNEDILSLDEFSSLTIRGTSTIINVPIMITFYNQVKEVDVFVAKASDEFSEVDYQKFNMSLGQYMDSIELSMYS